MHGRESTSRLLEETIAAWNATPSHFPDLGRRYNLQEQREREAMFESALRSAKARLLQTPGTAAEGAEAFGAIASEVARLACSALDLEDPCVETLLREDFSAVGRDLARAARRFDANVSLDDILQACRNAWTACGLQPLVDEPVHLTPAIFAYSMLYPYSDNYMDDPAVPDETKLCFSSRFRDRLAGDGSEPRDTRETTIWALVSLIESQYSRAGYPQVYDSLLAIHQAQENSLRQIRRHIPVEWSDLQRLTFAKGGASVMADACLAAGSLTRKEARFAFEWGVLLQMADDLQDLPADREGGFATLFGHAAEREPLDFLTNRTLNFGQAATLRLHALPHGAPLLKELLRRNASALLIRAAARSSAVYTRSYLAELEAHSPFRFSFLEEQQEEFAGGTGAHAKLFEALLFSDGQEHEQLCPPLIEADLPCWSFKS